MIRPWVANTILLLASTAWVVNFVMSIVRESYKVNESVNSVFLAVITGILATKLHDAKGSEGLEGAEDSEEGAGGGEGEAGGVRRSGEASGTVRTSSSSTSGADHGRVEDKHGTSPVTHAEDMIE